MSGPESVSGVVSRSRVPSWVAAAGLGKLIASVLEDRIVKCFIHFFEQTNTAYTIEDVFNLN